MSSSSLWSSPSTSRAVYLQPFLFSCVQAESTLAEAKEVSTQCQTHEATPLLWGTIIITRLVFSWQSAPVTLTPSEFVFRPPADAKVVKPSVVLSRPLSLSIAPVLSPLCLLIFVWLDTVCASLD
jgi:hypothetical protein